VKEKRKKLLQTLTFFPRHILRSDSETAAMLCWLQLAQALIIASEPVTRARLWILATVQVNFYTSSNIAPTGSIKIKINAFC
jgi:hypothetical protein